MAQVPSYSGGVRMDSSPLPMQRSYATPEAFGGGIAEGLGKLGGAAEGAGNALAQHAIQFQNDDNRAHADEALSAYIEQSDAHRLKYQDENQGKAGYENYGAAVGELKKIRGDLASSLPNEAARKDFASAARRQEAYAIGNLTTYADGERKRWINQSGEGLIETSKNNYANTIDPDQAEDALALIVGKRKELGALNGEASELTDAKAFSDRSQALRLRTDRLAGEAPDVADAFVKAHAGQFTAADQVQVEHAVKTALIPQQSAAIAKDVVHSTGGLSVDEQLLGWIKSGEDAAERLRPGDEVFAERVGARINAQASQMRAIENIGKRYRAEQNARVASDLEIRVNAGEATETEVDRAFDKKQITGPARASWITKLRKEGDYQGIVLGALAGERVLDPKDSKDRNAVGTYFDKVVAPALKDASPVQAKTAIAEYVEKTGIIPKSVRGQIRGGLRAGTVQQKATAADLLDRFSEASPKSIADFSVEDIALGKQVAQAVRDGVPAEQAVEHAEEMGKLSPDIIKRRRAELSANPVKDVEGINEGRLSTQGTQALVDEAQGHVWFGKAVVDDAAKAEFRRDFESAYIRTGDAKAAQAAAKSVSARTWGISSVNGRSELMKYAPETIYGVFDKESRDSDWIKKQLIEDVSKMGAFDTAKGPLEDRIRLGADTDTARDLTYTVMLKNEFGEYEPLANAKGKPLRWRPDYKATQLPVEAAKASAAAVRSAKFESQIEKTFSGRVK